MNLDPAKCRELASLCFDDDGNIPVTSAVTRIVDHLPFVAEQLTAAAELAEEIAHNRSNQLLSTKRIQQVVRDTFATVANLSGAEFAQRHIEDIATRVSAELATRMLSAKQRADLTSLRLLIHEMARAAHSHDPIRELKLLKHGAVLDRLLGSELLGGNQ